MDAKFKYRTKRVCKHPNPLFEKWLLEWKDQSEQHGSNMKYNYQRAIKSLQKYPLPIYTGRECLVLSHFGDKLCKLIDKKLEEHVLKNGPVNWNDYIEFTDVHPRKKLGKKECKQQRASSASQNIKRPMKNVRNRPYLPSYRSGAYGLLIALHNASMKDEYPGFLKKSELMDSAQEFCDASFFIPPMGSHYTAWSSMATLIKKNLVYKSGNPSKYSLTPEGTKLVIDLKAHSNPPSIQHEVSVSNTKMHLSQSTASQTKPSAVHSISSSDEDDLSLSNDQDETIVLSNDEDEVVSLNDVDHKEAVSLLDDDDSDSLPCLSQLSSSKAISSREDPFHNDKCNGLLQPKVLRNGIESTHVQEVFLDQEEENDWKFAYIDSCEKETTLKESAFVRITESDLQFLIKCKVIDLMRASLPHEIDNSRIAPAGYVYAFLPDSFAPEVSISSFESIPSTSKGTDKVLLSNSIGVKSASVFQTELIPYSCETPITSFPSSAAATNSASSTSSATPLFSLYPEQCKIVLCVDNAEVTGGFSASNKKCSRSIIVDELKTNGIDFDVRKLHIGDFLWIAQERYPSASKVREVVLPYIIERKRMDDLASSIRDGRFREQKFRLKKSSFLRLFYLVEEVGANFLSIPLSTCQQAISNTQIIDGFTIKMVSDQKESAAYLTIMTRYLQSLYKTLSVRDMFAKHLLQLSGLSIDKVTAILAQYPTPALLRQTLINTPVDEREELLSSLKCPKSGRSVGPQLSSHIVKLYCQNNIS